MSAAPDSRVNAAGDAPKTLIEFAGVGLTLHGRSIIGGLDLTIQRGEVVSVIGPSGCGKTTALRLAAGLVRATAGRVLFEGKPVQAPRRDIAIVFQDYGRALLPWRTAAGNVSLALEAAGVPRAARAGRIGSLLARVGLAGQNDTYPAQMSGGMQQRLQIARCLAQEPDVLLMDEPFGALDAMTRQTLQDEMLTIVADTGATVFFVTHDLEEAIYLGHRVVGLLPRPGRVGLDTPVDLPWPRNQLATREHPTLPPAAAHPVPFHQHGRAVTSVVRGLLVPVLLLLVAEAALRATGLRSDAVAPPSAVVVALWGALRDGSLLVATGQTLYGAVMGLIIGGVLGLVLGTLLGLSRVLDRLLDLTVEVVRPVPSIALIPIALLVLGFGPGMEIGIVAFSCTWPVLILTRAAVAGVEPQLLEVGRALGLSVPQRVLKIVLPAALPRLVVAFRLAFGVALVVAVTVEIAADPRGLGNGIMVAQQALQPALMLAELVWIGLLGVALNALLTWLQAHALGRAARPAAP